MSEVWQKLVSEKYQLPYWFNFITGESRWEDPTLPQNAVAVNQQERTEMNGSEQGNQMGRRNETKEGDEQPSKKQKVQSGENHQPNPQIDIAIIVPFRDLHHEQKRRQQLERFVPEMTRFLSKSSKTFHLYIVEQSNDQRRFNRGKLLNIGFHLAKTRYQQSQSQQPQGDGATTPGVPLSPPSVYVFHDVDLLPSNDLLPYYENVPAATSPVHIARVWNRYSNNLDYFGGIVSFSKDQFERINGFPNNFWGWGGEDDELIKRVKRVNLTPTAPTCGSIEDMEQMSLNEKLDFLRQHRDWKCQKKWEVLDEHEATWNTNGLSDLHYQLLAVRRLNEHCTLVTVDIQLNSHWTDNECRITDISGSTNQSS